jgi:DUF1365 family protein
VHQFEYRLFMMYLDLDELPSIFNGRWFWSATRPALARFRRGDHLGDPERPLLDCVKDVVEEETGQRPAGPIRLLTNLSYFGYCFNPVSFYYCFETDGETVSHIVAEVNNTPWGERDCYVMSCAGTDRGPWRFEPRKKMHVSPFMPMDIQYEWALSRPAARLNVHMANFKNGERFFDAGMSLERRPISARSLGTILLRFPLLTAKIMLAIHFEALRLWLKRCPFYEHPKKRNEVAAR